MQRSAQFVELAAELLFAGNSSPLQKCVERVEALKTATQNLLIGKSFFCPTLEHTINSDALGALKFVVIEIGIVNHFSHLVDDLVLDPEPFEQCLERAVISLMREFTVEHVERHDSTIRRNRFRKDKLRFGIDKLADQPGRTNAIDFRARTRD